MIKQMFFVASSFVILLGNLSAQDSQSAKKHKVMGRPFVGNPLALINGENGGNGSALSMVGGPMLTVVQRGGISGQPAALVGGPVSVNLFQSDVSLNGYISRDLTAANSHKVTVFDQKFRTTMATTFIQLTFSSQLWIDDDITASDGIAIECYLKQTDNAPVPTTTTTNFYGAPQGNLRPIILGSIHQLYGSLVWVTFSTYIPAAADYESEVIVDISTNGKDAGAANSQLHLAF